MIRRFALVLCVVVVTRVLISAQAPAPPDPAPQQLPGSTASLTVAQTRDAFNPPDGHPSAHPPMPESVAHGRRPEMRACGFCHLVNGQGRPENASLAGLPAAYLVQQMADFRNGDRKSAEPKIGPPNAMIQDAKAANDEDVRTAVEKLTVDDMIAITAYTASREPWMEWPIDLASDRSVGTALERWQSVSLDTCQVVDRLH